MLDLRQDAPGRLSLHGLCGLDQIELLAGALRELLVVDGPIQLDVSGVEDFDTSAVQVLLAFRAQRTQPVQITGWRPDLRARLDLGGFSELL